MIIKIIEKIKSMSNYIKKTFIFFKNCLMFLIYYQPSKAAMNYIENYISTDNLLEGITERWSESCLIEYYQKLEYNNLNIFDNNNQIIDLLYENLIDGNYTKLMLMIMTNEKMRINDYYKFYLLVKHNILIKEKLYKNPKFRNHLYNYIEKSKTKFNENISFKILLKKRENNNHKSCLLCYEDIMENTFYSKCKICKSELDLKCLNDWIKMDKNSCVLCRKNLLDEKESFNLILLQKYLDYLIISKELDLYGLNEFPS